MNSTVDAYNILGDNFLIANSWDHFDNISKHHVIDAGTHAQMTSLLLPFEQKMGRWHRSKENVAGNFPYGGYLTNKKWHLNEV